MAGGFFLIHFSATISVPSFDNMCPYPSQCYKEMQPITSFYPGLTLIMHADVVTEGKLHGNFYKELYPFKPIHFRHVEDKSGARAMEKLDCGVKRGYILVNKSSVSTAKNK